ncbi:MAG: aldehyde dehydrogenase family protein [Deltaproteobacteria bacterium]|nr:aldehyde dehydrogenase family protein [Deltaproteobacteria bacterium]
MSDRQFLNYIDGAWVPGSGSDPIADLNPADLRKVIGYCTDSTADDVDAAVEAGKKAFAAWRATPAPVRGRICRDAARLFEERTEEIGRVLTMEEGKVLAEAKGEVLKGAVLVEWFAGEARRLNGETVPSEIPNTFAYTTRQPLGVVGLITPWNFPMAIPAWKIAPALVAGNTVVIKGAEQTPWVTELVVKTFVDAGVPPGVLNMVQGRGATAGARLVAHPDVHAISFTGSTEIGEMIYAQGAALGKRVQCELGGKNPIIVLDDADVGMAVAAAAKGGFGSTGQRCTATSRSIVQRGVLDEFVSKMADAARAVVPGDGLDPATTMGPSVDSDQFGKVHEYLQIGKDEGAEVVVGGSRASDGELGHGLFTQPTLWMVDRSMRVAREEIFGPVMSVVPVDSFDEAIEVANAVDYGLTSSIYTQDVNTVFQYVDRIETGMLHVNSPTIGGEAQLPFGGIKKTGIGPREMGTQAIDFFCEWKVVYIDYGGGMRGGNLY